MPPLNRHRRRLIYLLVATLVTGGGFWLWSRYPSKKVTDETITVGEEVRRYRLVAPARAASAPALLVVALHGIGDTPEAMADYSGLDRLAATGQAYVVYPETRLGMWNTIDVLAESRANNRDLPFVQRLVDRLKSQLKVERVCLVGMSNGATFALLACEACEDIDGVVAHSGASPAGLKLTARAPILMIVGDADSAADAVRVDVAELKSAGHQVEFVLESGLGHQWSTRQNGKLDHFLLAP
ncbi:alpha/beta hydrolase family esterase [Blastopirellula retiformator]|uniref:Putative hydrolase n=1 Tax=Blastopirellula retiformator TaxID=2527970 RepID=A0A5C5UYA9_9BACT|nr:dienelactone hydrolase family protein [Blastopirellula retiformator]TWT30623.1 putative hydrolase [Blastopirellula retiformator]